MKAVNTREQIVISFLISTEHQAHYYAHLAIKLGFFKQLETIMSPIECTNQNSINWRGILGDWFQTKTFSRSFSFFWLPNCAPLSHIPRIKLKINSLERCECDIGVFVDDSTATAYESGFALIYRLFCFRMKQVFTIFSIRSYKFVSIFTKQDNRLSRRERV